MVQPIDQFTDSVLPQWKKDRIRRRANGLCKRCPNPAEPGKTKCKKCLLKYRRRLRCYRKRRDYKKRERAGNNRRFNTLYKYWRAQGFSWADSLYRGHRPKRFPINQPVSVEE